MGEGRQLIPTGTREMQYVSVHTGAAAQQTAEGKAVEKRPRMKSATPRFEIYSQ